MKISGYGIAMGVKQRRYPYEACLKSLATFCDEIIVAYDRRFDNPVIFSRISDKIRLVEVRYEFDKWDFINTVLTQARKECKGEWCYIYGMDEVFYEHQTVNLINAVDKCGGERTAITIRMFSPVFNLINTVTFERGGRPGLTRNLPELIHKTSDGATDSMESVYWDGKYIKFGFDDFGYYDESKQSVYQGDPINHFVEDAYSVPDEIANDIAKSIKYRIENYTHIWHYAWYNNARKHMQGYQTQIWQDRTYGRSPNLDIERQIQLLKETIIIDPSYTHSVLDIVKENKEWVEVELVHPICMKDWLEEMSIDAI
jgi:hypothetical protein